MNFQNNKFHDFRPKSTKTYNFFCAPRYRWLQKNCRHQLFRFFVVSCSLCVLACGDFCLSPSLISVFLDRCHENITKSMVLIKILKSLILTVKNLDEKISIFPRNIFVRLCAPELIINPKPRGQA